MWSASNSLRAQRRISGPKNSQGFSMENASHTLACKTSGAPEAAQTPTRYCWAALIKLDSGCPKAKTGSPAARQLTNFVGKLKRSLRLSSANDIITKPQEHFFNSVENCGSARLPRSFIHEPSNQGRSR